MGGMPKRGQTVLLVTSGGSKVKLRRDIGSPLVNDVRRTLAKICMCLFSGESPPSLFSFFFFSGARSSSREVRRRVPFLVVYFSRGILPTKKRGEKGGT